MLNAPAQAADDSKFVKTKFTGSQSCASSSCHGGGTGRNESIVFERRDRHYVSYGILAKGTSQRIAETLGIVGDPGKAAQCNVCHSPIQGVPVERLTNEAMTDKGVTCESCHGPAENWLRFHTRPDVNFQQIVAAGMRDLNDIYGRANTCVACHLNLDEAIRHAGHPELFFELDGQCIAEPPHYKDERPSVGPRAWLTGQAAALREMSWKLAAKRDDRLVARWKGLVWLLKKTESGKKQLPDGEDFAAVQSAADQLARNAARALWTKDQVTKQLRDYVSCRADFGDAKSDKTELRRRAEVLVPAIDRLWRALKKEGGVDEASFKPALENANLAAREQDDFEPAKFAAALGDLHSALEKSVKP
ncbi:MAG TPA: cytochrome c3 family protein [Chthoniobacteraceae bacterium]|nr:cytochrome c3 family protein [Chthoniobacteraceae bacterium]